MLSLIHICHGDQDAERRDDDGGKACRFQLFEIRAQTRREHDEHHAYFCKDAQPFFDVLGKENIIDCIGVDVFEKSDQKSCDQHTDDRGQTDLLRT